jgi:putative flippase GtrA
MSASPPVAASFRRYLLVGSAVTIFQFLLLALQIDGFGWPAALSSGLAFSAAVALNYEFSRRYTFYGRPARLRSLLRFVLVSLFGLTLNVTVFSSALWLGAPHYLVAQVIATGAVMIVNFQLYRRWTFAD